MNLGKVSQQRKNYAIAERRFSQCVTIMERYHGGDSPWTASVLAMYGSVLKDAEKYADAETKYLRALTIYAMKNMGPSHPEASSALKGIIELYEAWGKPDAAANWRAKIETQ